MHPFIDELVAEAEKPPAEGGSLADRLRDSFNLNWDSFDGALVNELTRMIDRLVDRTPAKEVRAAYNVVAECDGLPFLEEDEDLGGPYSEMFLNVVLSAIRGPSP